MKLADRPGSISALSGTLDREGAETAAPGTAEWFHVELWRPGVPCVAAARPLHRVAATGPHFWSRSGEKPSEWKAGPHAGNQIVDIEAVGVLTGQERPWARPLLPSPFFRFLPKPKNVGARPAYRGFADSRPWMVGGRPWQQDAETAGEHTPCTRNGPRGLQRGASPRGSAPGARERWEVPKCAESCGSDAIGASAPRRPDAAPGPCHAPRNAIIAPQAPISNVSCAGAAAPAVAGAIQTARTSR